MRSSLARWWPSLAGALMLIAGGVVARVTPAGAITAVAGALALGGAAVALATRHRRSGRALAVTAAVGVVLAGGLLAWVGANDPTVQWFGGITAHGDRTGRQVALTFDDGPADTSTLDVMRILDERGVKGTFFEIGKAVDARPEIVRALVEGGHQVGGHSYEHDAWRWLDPRYPELDRTQAAFQRALGRCPALFRPPHGQRTPFMLDRLSDRGMRAVTWDVSAQDWSDTDGARVAQRILAKVQPGSIVLLHDGLDGNVGADRSVLLSALPLILDGLRQRGLEPVRLDQLIGGPAWLEHC